MTEKYGFAIRKNNFARISGKLPSLSIFLCISIFGFLNPIVSCGQDDNCGQSTNNKAISLYEKGKDRKKYDKKKRMEFLRASIDADPGYLVPRLEYAKQIIRTSKYQGASIAPAVKHFLKIIDECPNFHSDPYFYLGEHYLEEEKYTESAQNYEAYLNFESDDDSKFNRKWEEMEILAKEDLKYAKFYINVYENPVPFNPVLVQNVSSGKDEYLPLISPDNNHLYYTRRWEKEKRMKNGIEIMDGVASSDKRTLLERFTKSEFDGTSFDIGMDMPSPFNEEASYNYGGASVSIDNRHMYLTICQPEAKLNGGVNCDLYETHYVQAYDEAMGNKEWHWTTLKNLGPNVNGVRSWEGQPSLSADGRTLFFASAREDSKGIDIYYTEKGPDGKWRKAVNVGAPINTDENDKAPFIHSDSQTLYYASQGHIGFGGFDVYFTRKGKDGKWSEPKNLGYPINTENDEHGFVVSTDGKKVFYGSEINKKNGTGLDIFSFELYKDARPEHVVFIEGDVKGEEGTVPLNATIELKNTKTQDVKTFEVDSNDGHYAAVIHVKEDEPIVMNIKAKGKVFNSKLIETKKGKVFQEVAEIRLEEIEIGKPYKINNITYPTNSSEINEESKLILDEFISYLRGNESLTINVKGHTDNTGSHFDNMALSADRAFSVMEYLLDNGITGKRIRFEGLGETEPIASNETEFGRRINRRTEFVITGK